MNLFFRSEGDGPPLIILHGLFGSSDNWISLAKHFGKYRKVYLVDLRNHGASPHDDDFSYHAMVEDLNSFFKQHDIIRPDILGHSMGGKVAMFFAIKYPDQVNKLMVIDIGPKKYPVHHDVILEGLKAIDIDKITRRQEADQALAEYVETPSIRQFLLKNLKRTDTGYCWKMNLEVIYDQVANVGEGLKSADKFSHQTLFVRGSLSNYIIDDDIEGLKKHFPSSELVTIYDASHWLHVEKPNEMIAIIKAFLTDE